MEEQFDTHALTQRVQLVAQQMRQSEAYPALIGGIAGGIVGALVVALIAARRSAHRDAEPPRDKESRRFDFSLREVAQLAPVIVALAKQIQTWSTEQRRKS